MTMKFARQLAAVDAWEGNSKLRDMTMLNYSFCMRLRM